MLDAELLVRIPRNWMSEITEKFLLRTRIVALDGVPEQVVADAGTVPIERIELPAALDDGEGTSRAESIAADRARLPFDLAAGPLLRAVLIGALEDQRRPFLDPLRPGPVPGRGDGDCRRRQRRRRVGGRAGRPRTAPAGWGG